MRVEASHLFFQDNSPRPPGGLTLAGLVRGSQGTGRTQMRVFGNYALVYVVAGGGFYRDAQGTRAQIQPGDTILVFPEIPHAYGPEKGGIWDEIYICFSGPYFDLWRQEGLINASRPVHHAEPIEDFLGKLQSVAREPRPTTAAENLAQLGRWTQLLAELVAFPGETVSEPSWLPRARALLEIDLGRAVDLEAIARESGLSYENFRKAFARETGISPNRYRTNVRLEAAKTLLLRGELTHAAVASSLGFRDEFHFSKRFKALTGLSPRQFQLAAREQKTKGPTMPDGIAEP